MAVCGRLWQPVTVSGRLWPYLIFVIFFTPTHFEAWKFYIQKSVNLQHKRYANNPVIQSCQKLTHPTNTNYVYEPAECRRSYNEKCRTYLLGKSPLGTSLLETSLLETSLLRKSLLGGDRNWWDLLPTDWAASLCSHSTRHTWATHSALLSYTEPHLS